MRVPRLTQLIAFALIGISIVGSSAFAGPYASRCETAIDPLASDDPYVVLGLDRTATLADLKQAFRRLAMKYHPDRNGGTLQAKRNFEKVVWARNELEARIPEESDDTPESGFQQPKPDGFQQAKPGDFRQAKPEDFGQTKPGGFTQAKPGGFQQARPEDFRQAKPEDFQQAKPKDAPKRTVGDYAISLFTSRRANSATPPPDAVVLNDIILEIMQARPQYSRKDVLNSVVQAAARNPDPEIRSLIYKLVNSNGQIRDIKI